MKSRCDYSPELARLVLIGIREVSVYRSVRCKVIVLGKQQTGCRRRGRDSRALECSFAGLCLGRIMGWRWGAERHMSERIERTSHESTMVPCGFEGWVNIRHASRRTNKTICSRPTPKVTAREKLIYQQSRLQSVRKLD